jgi:hypothetical protein
MSDTHTVFAVPRERKMLITKNRGIEFAGHVHVGTLDFYGEGFSFDYENFKIKMQEVDSLRFHIMTGEIDPRGQPVLARIQNALENITGTLYIDDPRNRSSRSPIYRYPYFESMESSYVYYDRPDIQNGAYKRDLFYFMVEPFILDSLDFAGSTSRLQLNGTLVSGIFPNFQEKLRFQDDLSLGFAAFTPEAGYPTYGGKGTYFNNITLDKQGLHGYGKLQYLTSMSESNNFVFRPENTSAQLDKYAIKKGSYQSTSYPTLTGENVAMLWKAKADSMLVYRGAAAFEVYDGIALFEGDLTYTPKQLYASGTLLYGRDKITSRSFALAQQKAFSEQLRLEIASNTPDLLALKTDDLEGEVDFTKRYGTFRNRTGETRVELPYNEYSAKLQDLEWDLRNNKLVLGATKDLKMPKTTFRSEHPGMDGFNFKAAFGAMDLNIFDLDLRGIPEMRTADAIVLPDSGKALVTKEAKMMPLKNARLVFDSLKQEHQVYRASVDILGRKRYEAAGIYDYVNSNKQKQAIFLDIIRPNINGISVASGTISPDSNFMLNPGFGFSGGVAVSSAKKAITFNGLVRLTELPDTIRNSPFRYNSDFDPQETYIQVPEFKDDLNRKMFAGLMLNQANWQIYAAFGGSKMASQDSVLLEASGVVRFTEATKVYEIGPEKLILQGEGFGNTLILNPASKQVTAKGKIRLGFDKDAIRFASGGEISHKYLEGKTDFLLSVLIDALLPDDALKIFYNQLVDYSFGAEDVNNDQDYVKAAFGNLLTGKAVDRVITSIENFGTIPNSEGTDYLFVLSNIDLSWDSDTRSFRSKETIGLANMNGETVGKRLNGIFEIQILPTGRSFNLLLEPSSEVYFFFNYRNNRIYPISSMMEFNDATKTGLGKKKKKGVENKVSMGITQNRDRLVTRHSNWLGE